MLVVASWSSPLWAVSGQDETSAGSDQVEAAIEAASETIWQHLARADAKVKALGLGSTVGGGSGGSEADPGAKEAPRDIELSGQLHGEVPASVRQSWAIHIAGSQLDVAVQQGRFKVENETTIPGGNLMIISYAVLWILLLAFTGVLAVRERRLAAELEALESELADLDNS
jgi:hypothetical protein